MLFNCYLNFSSKRIKIKESLIIKRFDWHLTVVLRYLDLIKPFYFHYDRKRIIEK